MSTEDESTGRARQPMIGQRVGSAQEPLLQDNVAGPVVEHPELPAMGEDESGAAPPLGLATGGGGTQPRFMTDKPQPPHGGRGRMPEVPNVNDTTSHRGGERPEGDYPEQRGVAPSPATGPGGYLRLQFRAAGGEVSLLDVTRVDGPLGPPEPLYGGVAYEVTVGPEQVGVGAVPDPGVRRGLAPLDRPELGHFIEEVPTYEFTARVPVDKVTPVNLPDLQVIVYRLDSTQVINATPDRPLREQAGRQAEEVAALRGINRERLPHELRASIDRALR